MNEEFRQFLIDELCKAKEYNKDTLSEYGVGVHNTYVYSLRKYDEFHEPVVIPKFMSDWIEENRERYKNTFFSIGYDLYSNTIHPPVDDWIIGNQEKFVRAWFDVYKIEEEQKYYAKLKEIKPLEKEWLTNLSGPKYYVIDAKGLMLGEFLLDLVGIKTEASAYTLKDWERHGINDSNADFVRVDE